MNFKEYLNKNKVEYGLPNSRQNLIDELVEISEFIFNDNKNLDNPDQIFKMAGESKVKSELDSISRRLEDVRIQVLDILKEKFSKVKETINNDKETSKTEKETKNERSKGKGKEGTSRGG